MILIELIDSIYLLKGIVLYLLLASYIPFLSTLSDGSPPVYWRLSGSVPRSSINLTRRYVNIVNEQYILIMRII